ncbi:beta-ketoacyl synthase N-terminal-like domain-containing protein [Streptomyces sp. NPDC008001]|uniref:beta-ketoacyl synthase N-terminal-like domain-containing protein n=1 Tax=Streptomyces sp. NPDC008001 TaxID=3364804 RepID=UPI0036E80600
MNNTSSTRGAYGTSSAYGASGAARSREAAVTGVGLAVPGIAFPDELLGAAREGGFDPRTGLTGREMRHKDRASRLALRAAEPALRDAGLHDGRAFTGDGDTTAVVVSSNFGILDSVCAFADVIARDTVTGLSPLGLPQTSSNVIAGSVAMRYGLRGPSITLCNGPTSGLDAVHWARGIIASGRAETVVVIGVEPSGDAVTKLLGEPVLDGAAALVLQARERGARPRAVIREGAYARGTDPAAAVAAALGGASPASVGLWLTGEDAGGVPGSVPRGVPAVGLAGRLGRCSGALGVLQCAAAVAYFDSRAEDGGAVLASAGGPADDAAAALLLTAP